MTKDEETSMDSVKIASLELENVKRIRTCFMTPTATGLTVIGGRNNQGKTSVLDAIAWALGGDRYRPSQATREGSVIPPHLKVTLSNGIVVERMGKNSDLKVTDPQGRRAGQQLLNSFVEQLAINLPKFMESTSREKVSTLLKIIGVGDKLAELERQEAELYNKRLFIGRIGEQKAKYAAELIDYPDVPSEPISASQLIRQQQDILAQNGENQRKRLQRDQLERRVFHLTAESEKLQEELAEAKEAYAIALQRADQLEDQSTATLESSIQAIDVINAKVRSNMDKERAEDEAADYHRQYDILTAQVEDIRREKGTLLQGASLPLEGLSVVEGELTYHGKQWDNMSGSERLKVSTAIVRALNPVCGFVLLDKLEQMDLESLEEFGVWMKAEGLQGIATRVSTGGECSIIIEDGYQHMPDAITNWKAGEF